MSPFQSHPCKNNSMSGNMEMVRESHRARAQLCSVGAEEAFGNSKLWPHGPVHSAGLQRTLLFFIISLSVIGFLLNLFAWFVLQCVSGNILHLCILITVKFEDKNRDYAGSCS